MTQELRRLAEAATQGKWEAKLEQGPYPNWYLIYSEKVEPPLIVQVLRGSSCAGLASHADYFSEKTQRDVAAHANATYIAAANPAAILSLLDRLEKAEKDSARLDWLEQNLFNRENVDWITGEVSKTHNMWVTFAPVGVQGSARKIIDAAMEASK